MHPEGYEGYFEQIHRANCDFPAEPKRRVIIHPLIYSP